jgi:hypothetical protein
VSPSSNLGLGGPPRYWTGGRLPPRRTRDRIHSETSSSYHPTAIGPSRTRFGKSPSRSKRQIWTAEYPVRRTTSDLRMILRCSGSPFPRIFLFRFTRGRSDSRCCIGAKSDRGHSYVPCISIHHDFSFTLVSSSCWSRVRSPAQNR